MYLDYFGLDKDPFTISPDPAFLYPSPQHRKALAHLKYGLDREGGFILLTGEVGTGKTTLTRLLLEQLPGNIRVAYILNAKLNSEDVLASICQELQLDFVADASIKVLTDVLYKDLLSAHSEGKKTLLVVEEAQNLDPDVLETLRLLTNLETNTQKLLHILLVGQPELLELLSRTELRQLNQRVVSRFHIDPLNLSETSNYLVHRLKRAGCARPIFDSSAVKYLHKLSGGIPRVLNLLAERSLLGAYATNSNTVSVEVVKSANEEVFGVSVIESSKKSSAFKSAFKPTLKLGLLARLVLAVLLTISVAFYLGLFDLDQPVAPALSEQDSERIDFRVEPDVESEGESEKSESAEVDLVENEVVTLLGNEENFMKASTELPTKNAFERLLAIWGIDADVSNQSQLCALVENYQLRCQMEEGRSFSDMVEINRPGVVILPTEEDSFSVFLITSISDDRILLSNALGSSSMEKEAFLEVWDETLTYLWKLPEAFSTFLKPGDKDANMVDWIQQQLAAVHDDYEYIIGGGIYSEPIVLAVSEFQAQQGLNSDGLLGPRTILRLMEQTETLPRLIVDVEQEH